VSADEALLLAAAGVAGGALGIPLVTAAQGLIVGGVRLGIGTRVFASAACAALFLLAVGRTGLQPELPALLILAAAGVVLSIVDVAEKRLPNRALILTAASLAIALSYAAAAAHGGWALIWAAAGAGGMFAIYFVLALISPRGMGMGDVKLAGVLGLVLGFLGWRYWILGLVGGVLIGGVIGLVALAVGRAHRATLLPFGPSMLLGAFLAIALA
jgi:leader peptidase (prepilin peptidase)/N-methyltransferase